MLNPFANKAFWWASALLAGSGMGLSFYAVHLTEVQWTRSVEARGRQIAQAIEQDPLELPRIIGSTTEQISVYDSEMRLLGTSRAIRPQNSDADLDAIRAVLQEQTVKASTGETVNVVLPIKASGRPAAVLHLTTRQQRAGQPSMLCVGGCYSSRESSHCSA